MEIFDYIFCDDIRTEQSNKNSLMGVYNDRIVIKTFPGAKIDWPLKLKLCCYIRLKFDQKELRPNAFAVELLLDGKSILTPGGKTPLKSSPDSAITNISVLNGLISVNNSPNSHIGFKLTVYDGDNVIGEFIKDSALLILIEPLKVATALI